MQRLTFDQAFLGADAVTADLGIREAELEQTRLKEIMIERAGKVYVPPHADKLGRKPFHAWAPIPKGALLVTDATATDVMTGPFEQAGLQVVRAG